MTILDQIKGRVAYYVDLWQREPRETSQSINTLLTFGGTVQRIKTPLITCKDCKYGKAIESIGCLMFNHVESRLQPKDPDGFCAWAERG